MINLNFHIFMIVYSYKILLFYGYCFCLIMFVKTILFGTHLMLQMHVLCVIYLFIFLYTVRDSSTPNNVK